MARKKSRDDLTIQGDIKLAMHECALTGGNKKRKARPAGRFFGSEEERYYLYDKMLNGEASSREIVYLSLLSGMINEEQYADFLQIEKDCEETKGENCKEDR